MGGEAMIIIKDCIEFMREQPSDKFACVVTSPPYNIGVDYGHYKDAQSRAAYRQFTLDWVREALRVSPVCVINFGAKTSEPVMLYKFGVWLDAVGELQQAITWVKSVHVAGTTYGHYKPVNSDRYLSNTYEQVFVVSRDGNWPLNKLAVGVPYQDKSNIGRRGHAQDLRDRGNVWYVPYKTRQVKLEHPATYPQALAEMMIKLVYPSAGEVYDPFAGTGTTLLAAATLGIPAVGTDTKDWGYNG